MATAFPGAKTEPKPPALNPALSASIEVGMPIELGTIDGGRERFIPILAGKVDGPRLDGIILAAGGDWMSTRHNGNLRLRQCWTGLLSRLVRMRTR